MEKQFFTNVGEKRSCHLWVGVSIPLLLDFDTKCSSKACKNSSPTDLTNPISTFTPKLKSETTLMMIRHLQVSDG